MGRNRWSAVSVPCHMDENMKANGAVPLGKAGTYHLSHYPSPSFLGESDRAGWFVVYKHRTKSLLWRLYIVLVCAFSFFFLLFFFFFHFNEANLLQLFVCYWNQLKTSHFWSMCPVHVRLFLFWEDYNAICNMSFQNTLNIPLIFAMILYRLEYAYTVKGF